jgi:acyl-CoA thioesterase
VSKDLRKKFDEDPFGQHIGAELLEFEPGRAVAALDFRPELANFAGVMHGGAVFALADFAFGAAANSKNNLELAVNITINYLAGPQPGERLIATVEEIGGSRKLGHYKMEVKSESGKLIASLTGITYRKGGPLV